jgi:hypothetical protein
MGFLDNSGDIILDAVLTDTGRMRLAKGDGTFKITKFAFGDDEINYKLYRNANNPKGAHPSGSNYYDLDIMETPVLQAFTNDTSFLKSKLVSLTNTNYLFLPILKLNELKAENSTNTNGAQANGKFVVLVDKDTSKVVSQGGLRETGAPGGMIAGIKGTGASLRVDQGLDTDQIDPATPLAGELYETQYMIEMDNRFSTLISAEGEGLVRAKPSFINDDNIAAYYLTLKSTSQFVKNNGITAPTADALETIAGPRGSMLKFSLLSSLELQRSNTLFTKVGHNTATWTTSSGSKNIRYIDTIIKVTGLTTGYRIDVPVRFVKLR